MALSMRVIRKAITDISFNFGMTGRQFVPQKGISTTAVASGKRNFRKFHLGNKRGTRYFRRDRNAGLLPDFPIETEVKPIGYKLGERFHVVPEMVPQFVVPDLTNCNLKPYVSYRVKDVYQEQFTPEDLFQAVYEGKIEHDFKEGKLDENGSPKEPSPEELLTAEVAWLQARKTGSDIFSERIPKHWECLDIDIDEWNKEKLKKAEEEQEKFFSDLDKKSDNSS